MADYSTRIDELIVKLINIYDRYAKIPRDYDIEEKILPSDIHMIEFIGTNPEKNTSELTELCGLTKGTTSKRLSRLEKMGYVEYYHLEDNQKEKYYRLTEKGNKAFWGHYKFHEEKNRVLNNELKKYSDHEIEVITGFLNKYNEYLKSIYK